MTYPILTIAIQHEHDVVTVRQRCRQIARLLGFDPQDQTRVATAVSEIARNAFIYAGGGRVELGVEGSTTPQLLLIQISDHGKGIEKLEEVLQGRYTSTTGMGIGITGARRLMDQFEIQSSASGTSIWLKKFFPRRAPLLTAERLAQVTQELAAEKPKDAFAEIEHQNQELLRSLDELRRRQEDLTHVNRELEETNRGVVALYAELDEKADHLRRADELKSKFLSNMSHEFRSPLNSILGLTDLLLNDPNDPLDGDQRQHVGYIRRAADDLYELVNDLLDLAKVEAGKIEVKPVYFEVANLFAALRGMLRPLFLNQSVTLTFEDCRDIPPMYSDEGKISQILRNFLSNALKFTERGEVRVAATVEGERIRFSVSDTGIGIAKSDQERIFQDFVQVDGPLQRRIKGTGLGLPLSKKLAQLLRGDVSVESAPGLGSTFSLDIPLSWQAHPIATVEASAAESAEGIPVLVLENRADALLLYSRWLMNTEFRMIAAGTVHDAELKIAAHKPSLLVLDVMLDGEDSWGLLASLKNSQATRHIPVVMITTVDDPRKALNLGADDYMVKPINREAMLGSMRRLTGSGARVLIIDDDEKDRHILKYRLRASGMEIMEASSGEEGIAKAVSGHPKLIFLDLSMPGMSGYEVLDALKADPRTASITVVVNTSLQLGEDDAKRLNRAAAAILYKSQGGRALETLIARLETSGAWIQGERKYLAQ